MRYLANRLLTTDHCAKIVLLIVLFFSVVCSPSSVVHSITPLELAQNDYAFQISKYQDTKDKFQTARANYLTYKTATAKSDAFIKTKDYLLQIKNLYVSYLFLVKERTNTINWDNTTHKKEDINLALNAEIDSINTWEADIKKAQTLEELTPLSQTFAKKITAQTLPVVYKSLVTTDISQLEDVLHEFNDKSKLVDALVLNKTATTNAQLYDNWKSEIAAISQKANKGIQAYNEQLKTLALNVNFSTLSTNFKFNTTESRDVLKSTKSILRELLNLL